LFQICSYIHDALEVKTIPPCLLIRSVPSAESLSLPSESKTQRTEAYDVLLQGLRVEQMALCCDHCRSICFNK
jgi:hypothetical protein